MDQSSADGASSGLGFGSPNKLHESPSHNLVHTRKRTQLLRALSISKKEKWTKTFLNFWKSLDIYGEKIELTYKGRKSYKTIIGATFSLIFRLLVWFFIVY
jgi:hypothetical protein